jgi:hypothetical protein
MSGTDCKPALSFFHALPDQTQIKDLRQLRWFRNAALVRPDRGATPGSTQPERLPPLIGSPKPVAADAGFAPAIDRIIAGEAPGRAAV